MTKIFYVEDEVFLAKIIQESLESRGYDVCWIGDGAKAIEKLEDYEPDICVLDVMLPNTDGFEIGRAIKALQPDLPLLFLTAKDQTQDVLEGFRLGANDYIRKPCSIEELIVRIENLLLLTQGKKEQPDLESEMKLGDFVFYTNQYLLRHKDGEEVKLSHKEAELVKLLATNVNQTINRQEILDTVWGDDTFFNSRTLDVYITKLRQYFKKDENVKIITLRGVGYHFSIE